MSTSAKAMRIIGIILLCLGVVGVLIAVTRASNTREVIPLAIFYGVLGAVLLARSKRNGSGSTRPSRKSLREQRELERKEFLRSIGCIDTVRLQHLQGLPVANGGECMIGIGREKFLFQRDEKEITLPLERVVDVVIKTEEEVNTHYVKDYWDWEPEKITDTKITQYLIITYFEEKETKNIYFLCTNIPDAQKIVDIWRSLPRRINQISL